MIKPSNRMRANKDGISTSMIILLLIVLVFIASIWIPIPFISDITSGIGEGIANINEPTPDIITFTVKAVQISTGDIIGGSDIGWPGVSPTGNVPGHDIEPDSQASHEDYKMVIQTNAPRVILGTPWKLVINSELHYTGTNQLEFNQNWDIRSGNGVKEFEYQYDHSKMAWDTWFGGSDWTEFSIFLFNPENTAVIEYHYGTG